MMNSPHQIETHANQPEPLSGGEGTSMDGAAVDVVVHDSSNGSSALTRSVTTGVVRSWKKDDPAPNDMDYGSLSENEKLMNLFRLAMKDERRMETLIARANDFHEDVWKRALLSASSLGYAQFIFNAFFREAPSWRKILLITARDRDGFTWLHRAVIAGKKDVVELLSRLHLLGTDLNGDNFNAFLEEHDPHLSVENFTFEVLHARTKEGWTSVHLAVAAGAGNTLNLLIQSYGSLAKFSNPAWSHTWDFLDRYWLTPLHYAVLGNRSGEMAKLLKWSLFDGHVNAHDYYVRTALHMAAFHSEQATKILVGKNKMVDINAVDGLLYTPLHCAVYAGNTGAVRCLLSLAGGRTVRATEEDIEGKSVLQIAVENIMVDSKVSKDIEKLLLTSAEVKDEVERLYRDRQVYVDAANAILVGAALIASVTFGGWLQPPQGGNSRTNLGVRVFWSTNSLSFFFALATVIAGGGTVLPLESVYIGTAVRNIRRALALTSFLLMISVVLVLLAFAAAGFASLDAVLVSPSGPQVTHLRVNMKITTCIGAVVCGGILLWFCRRLYKIRPNWRRLLFEIGPLPQAMMHTSEQGRDYEEIQSLVDAAAHRAREDRKRNGIQSLSIRSRKRTSRDIDLVNSLKRASERAAEIQREARQHIKVHGRDQVVEQQLRAFEEAYERATSGSAQEAKSNVEILDRLSRQGLGPQGIHFWIPRLPKHCARTHSLNKDRERRDHIDQILKLKKVKLEEERINFEDGILALEDWGF